MVGLMLAVTIIVVFIGQYLINKLLNTMLLGKLSTFIKRWEGGLSRDPADDASSNPAPWSYNGQTGWHTNKGVTYTTFQSNAKKVGYEVNAKNFFEMPDSIWYGILKESYVKGFPIDRIAHLPRIQAVIITWAWGSGVGGAETRLARFQREVMGINDSNITKDEIVDNFRKRINPFNELEWFNKLCDRRLADFKKMDDWSRFGKGWSNRLNDFRKTFQ